MSPTNITRIGGHNKPSGIAQLVNRTLAKTQVVVSSPGTSPLLAMVRGLTGLVASWLLKRSADVAPGVELREC